MRKLIPLLAVFVVTAASLSVMSPAEAGARYTVSVAASAASADVGQTITLSGQVSPRARGERVLVQRLAGSTWTTVTRARLNRHSRYTTAVAVQGPGDNAYRVVKPRSHHHRKGISATVTVVGWRWRPLASMPVAGTPNRTVTLPSGILGGQPYSPFIEQADPTDYTAGIVFSLDRRCTRLDIHVGGTANSAGTGDSYAYLNATYTPADAGPALLFSGPVHKNSDPVHIVRGPEIVAFIETLELDASHDLGNGVGWGGAMAYCRS